MQSENQDKNERTSPPKRNSERSKRSKRKLVESEALKESLAFQNESYLELKLPQYSPRWKHSLLKFRAKEHTYHRVILNRKRC